MSNTPSPVPSDYLCPIGQEYMRDPVTIDSGMTYELANIVEWFRLGNDTCPLTRQKVNPNNMKPNIGLELHIKSWLEQHAPLAVEGSLETPIEAFEGHFLLPSASSSADSPTTGSLVELLKDARSPFLKAQLLHRLVVMAAGSRSNRQALINAGIVAIVVEFLCTGSASTRWQAAELISYLSLEEVHRAAFFDALFDFLLQAGIHISRANAGLRLKKLGKLLESGQSEQRTIAAWALWLLSTDNDARSIMLLPQLVQVLVKALSANNCESCRIGAARTLRALAMLPRTQIVFHKCNAVGGLLAMLHNDHSLCKVAACTALCNIAFSSQDDTLKALLISPDVLDTVKQLLMPGDSVENRCAARMVKALCTETANIPVLLQYGLLNGLVQLLSIDEQLTAEAACSALYAVVDRSNPSQRTYLLRSGTAVELAELLKRSHIEGVRFCASHILANLCNPHTVSYFLDKGVLDAVVEVLQSSNQLLQFEAACILLHICRSSGKVEQVCVDDAGVIRSLIQLLSSPDTEHQHVAASLLRHLASSEVNRPYIAKAGGIHALLDMITGRFTEQLPTKEATAALSTLAQSGAYFRNEIRRACGKDLQLPHELCMILDIIE